MAFFAVNSSRSTNFAAIAKPAPAPTPRPAPSPIPQPTPVATTPVLTPAAHSDFSSQPKTIPSNADCEVICDSAGNCYCPDKATDQEAQAAADQAKAEIADVVDTAKDVGKYLSMADATFSLLNLANTLATGLPIANEANDLNVDANTFKFQAQNLQFNLNSSISTLNQGIATRDRALIQQGFNGLAAAQDQANQLQAQGRSIEQRASQLQSKVAAYESRANLLQSGSQILGYGSQGAGIFSQGYQAATDPSAQNIGNVFASAAQTTLKAASDFTSFVSPIGAQVGSGAIEAGRNIGIQAGQEKSPTDIALGAVSFFGGAAYKYAQQANVYAGQGNEAKAAEFATYAAIDVARLAASATGVAAPIVMVGAPLAMGFTGFGSKLAQGADFETAAIYGSDIGFANSPIGKALNASNLITGAKQGEVGWVNATQPVTGLVRTTAAPLATTTLTRDSSGRLRYNYQPSLEADFRSQGALVQQIQPEGTTFTETSLQIAAAKQAAIRAQLGGATLSTNFAQE
jgi:hypothetical protein